MAIVPDIIGVDLSAAIDAIQDAGLTVNLTVEPSTTVAFGYVISQDPAAGTTVDPGYKVGAVIAVGTIMPDVVGMSQAAAIAAIEAAGLVVTTTENYSESVTSGNVISQAPNAYTIVGIGALTSINVSKGSEYVIVPDMTGVQILDADDTLGLLGLVSYYTGEPHETLLLGQVISQDPEPGLSVLIGSTVAVVVSNGVPLSVVPDVVGKIEVDAIAAIEAEDLVASVTEAYDAIVDDGVVISQTPDAGTTIETGADVCIVISKGIEPVPPVVPDVVGLTQTQATSAIQGEGLTVTVLTEYSATVTAGKVIRQFPAADTVYTDGYAVLIMVAVNAGTPDADVVNQIATYLGLAIPSVTAWRTTLPPGYSNTTKALVVNVQAARSHQTNATRGVEFTIRVYGGSNKIATATELTETVLSAINAQSSSVYGFVRFGDLSWQELPPEPVTGWPSCLIRGRVRTT